ISIVVVGIQTVDRMTNWRSFALLGDGSRRREDAVIYGTGLSNQPDSLAFGSRGKSNNLAHISLLLDLTPIVNPQENKTLAMRSGCEGSLLLVQPSQQAMALPSARSGRSA